MARGTSRPTLGAKKPGPILLPELAKHGDGDLGTSNDHGGAPTTSDNLDEVFIERLTQDRLVLGLNAVTAGASKD